MRIALSVCSALSVITSVSASVTPDLPPSCQNGGLLFAEYTSPAGQNKDGSYSSFDPTVFKKAKPNYSGLTYTVGGWYAGVPAEAQIYGISTQFNASSVAVDHHGYFYVPTTGAYSLATPYVDDIFLAWVGSKAYSGWTRQNANLATSQINMTGIYNFTATRGQYVPIRFIWGQDSGPWGLSITLSGPGGVNIITSGQTSRRVFQFGCNASNNAPPFPAYGNET